MLPLRRIMLTKSYTAVLDFWFGAKTSPSYLKEKSSWYGSPADDAFVRTHLGDSHQAAKDGQLDAWTREGAGEEALALILLLDQVPRNIFRDTPQAYATDSQAVRVARDAVEQGWDRDMPAIQRRYMYSSFNQSDDLKVQEMSVKLFTDLGDRYHLHWARNFYEQIKRDGRFTHRDRILRRCHDVVIPRRLFFFQSPLLLRFSPIHHIRPHCILHAAENVVPSVE